ncbi:hypothetical protein F0562_013280 [Nyssa sinensis]|uniref:Replication factor C C-terminal domain-containing protein n=1 Tax=Nyssa sinensis TaxID=561372 RepID=A0A5J4ZWA2_9ASTE|nr:hypothetical protein F0562_013280 [Nyssa sinensis]
MEIYSNSTRFALACNTSSKIIEPIQSRCALVRFARLSDHEILGRLMVIVEVEQVPCVPEGLEAIIFTADGLKLLSDLGYSPTDIIITLFRIIKNYDMAEYLKLEFMKETGFAHMRICDGVGSYLQLCGLLAKLALVRGTAKAA